MCVFYYNLGTDPPPLQKKEFEGVRSWGKICENSRFSNSEHDSPLVIRAINLSFQNSEKITKITLVSVDGFAPSIIINMLLSDMPLVFRSLSLHKAVQTT